jgi:hypothetical protein
MWTLRAILGMTVASGIVLPTPHAFAHDVVTTKITWNREIVRIMQARCASCHREGGSTFSLETYEKARPWAKAIQEEVLERRMPPWGAVKGFGDFKDDAALTPEQIELIADWVEGGAPEGEAKDLPAAPDPSAKQPDPKAAKAPAPRWKEVPATAGFRLTAPIFLQGLWPRKVSPDVSFQVTAELPDGSVQPLLWILPFQPIYAHAFWLRTPLALPAGTRISGIPPGVTVSLLAGSPTKSAAGKPVSQ